MEEKVVRINEKKKEVIIKNINKNRGSYKEKILLKDWEEVMKKPFNNEYDLALMEFIFFRQIL